MLKAILPILAAALLTGCGPSSLRESGIARSETIDAPVQQQVTAAVVPTSLSPETHHGEEASTRRRSAGPNAAEAAAAISAVNTAGSAAYKIGPQDVLEITVFKVSELSKTAQVSEAGTIGFPLVGELIAAGRTPREV